VCRPESGAEGDLTAMKALPSSCSPCSAENKQCNEMQSSTEADELPIKKMNGDIDTEDKEASLASSPTPEEELKLVYLPEEDQKDEANEILDEHDVVSLADVDQVDQGITSYYYY
jgi:hypothetical protein